MRCYPPPEQWVTRAQVWLGTLVEIALPQDEATEASFAAGFAAIAHVHRRMSAHDPASDLARIARSAHRQAVIVDRDTMAVLQLARDLSQATQGRFDVTVPRRHGPGRRRPARRGGMSALQLERGRLVRTDRPLALDLSGIAKGHAVDRAVDALRRAGGSAGLVNAGGDLRVFGAGAWLPVRLRVPQAPSLALRCFDIRDAAVASSADYFRDGRPALFDLCHGRTRTFRDSVSVVAPTCALADALTKVVALMPARCAPLLARFGAHAFRLVANGRDARTTCHASTQYLRLAAEAAA